MKAIALATLLLTVAAAAPAVADDKDIPKLKGTLTYTRSGGLAGVDDRFTIKRDGRARLDGRSLRLLKVERDSVAALVDKADLASVKVVQRPAVPDAFIHSITYRGRTITFDDPSTPKKVKKLADLLGRLVQKYDDE
jgi:hypothetical protein